MCGRYALYDASKSEIKIARDLTDKNYNVLPSSMVPVVNDDYELNLVTWSFKVPWAEKLNIINARSETLETKKIFQNSRRCIFIANGYFEWLTRGKTKVPFYHTFRDKMMYLGGILNDLGACIVTRQSYRMEFEVHHRQPIILDYHDFDRWFTLRHDYSCEHTCNMNIYEVSPKVNSPNNNSAENIQPI